MHQPNPDPADLFGLLKHADWAHGLAHALMADHAAAEDITQDALVLALSRPAQSDRRSWLAATLRNLANQRRRKDARRGRRERVAARDERLEDHASVLGELEAKRRLMRHVMALGERNRDVLVLRYVDGETPRAIAALQGCSVASVSNQLTRAHALLRQRLEADGGERAWIGTLVPLLGTRAAEWGSAGGATAWFGTGAWASALWTLCKVILAAALLGSLWAGLTQPSVAPTLAGGSTGSHGFGEGDLAAAGDGSLVHVKADRSRAAPESATKGAMPPSSPALSGSLTALLLDSSGAPVPGATLDIRSRIGSPLVATTNDQGRARWSAAPAGTDLAVGIELDGRRWHEPIAHLQLESGEAAIATWTIHVASVIRGVVSDEGGARLPGQMIQLVAWKKDSPIHAYHPSENEVYASAVTDQAGRFVFPRQTAGRYALFPAYRPDERGERLLSVGDHDGATHSSLVVQNWTEVAHCEVCLDVPYNQDVVDVDATFYTGGAIHGRVVEATSGSPIRAKAVVSLFDLGRGSWIVLRTDEQGNFVTPPLPPGQYELAGHRGPSGWCPGERTPVERGAEDATVPFDEAVAVKLRPEFAAGVEPAAGVIQVEAPSSESAFLDLDWHRLDLGQFECDATSLPPGTYGFLFVADDGSCAGSVAPIELGAGRLPGGVVIPVVPAATVEVLNNSDDTTARVTCYLDTMQFHTAAVAPGETVSVPAPPGNVTVRITGDSQDVGKRVVLKAVSGRTYAVEWK